MENLTNATQTETENKSVQTETTTVIPPTMPSTEEETTEEEKIRIKVGVNEDVVLSGAEINDKDTLVVKFRLLSAGPMKAVKSVAQQMESGDDDDGESKVPGEAAFLFFMPKLVSYDDDTIALDGKVILDSFTDFKNQLAHILKRFIPAEANRKFFPFMGTPINPADEESIFSNLQNETVATMVYMNYAKQFINHIKPFINNENLKSRLFCTRRSEAVHFPTLRKKFLQDQPFLEDSKVRVEMSKLYIQYSKKTTQLFPGTELDGVRFVPKFSKYELTKNLDSNVIIEKEPTDSEDTAREAADAAMIFTGGDVDGSVEGAGGFGFTVE